MSMSIKSSLLLCYSAKLWHCQHYLYAFCVLFLISSVHAKTETLCDPNVLYAKLSAYQKQAVEGSVVSAQQQLRSLGYLIREDDIAGLETTQALYQFCRAINYSQDDESLEPLLQQLQRYVVISESYPDWQQTVSSPQFAKWLAMQPKSIALTSLWDAGSAPLVMKLLEEYEAQQSQLEEEPSHYYILKEAQEGYDFLEPIINMPFANQHLFEQAVNKLLGLEEDVDKPSDFNLASLTSKALQLEDKPLRNINLSGGDCGCRQQFKAGSEVIGFYPYWMSLEADPAVVEDAPADDKEPSAVEEGVVTIPEPDIIDFSNLSRIAYYAMSLDEQGLLKQPRHWQEDVLIESLFEQAHKYMTRVDLVVYSNHWHYWDDEAIDSVVRELLSKVLLRMKEAYGGASLLESIQANPPNDGIILYFGGYPQQGQSRKNIVTLIERLRKKMVATGLKQRVSIMLDIDFEASKRDGKILGDLANTMLSVIDGNGVVSIPENSVHSADTRPMVDHLLAFLEEPTTQSKKDLHRILSNEFRGRARSILLNKVIPILSPINQSSEPRSEDEPYIQFIDDLIYAQNNFGGVGMWPLVIASQSDAEKVNGLISDEFASLEQDQLQSLVESHLPGLCTFLCPNRTLVWQLLLTLAILILAYALVAFWYCKARLFYKDHQLYFMGLALGMLGTGLALMVCNPMMPWSSDAIAIGLLLLMMGYWVWGYVVQIQKDKLP